GLQGERSKTVLIQEAFRQIEAYFNGQLFEFSLPLAPQGTDFMQSVWQALRDVPYAKTVSYKDIAIKIGNPKAARAVGMANNRNPISIVIPCHRVIGSGGIRVKTPSYTDGQLVGYRSGLENKRKLLELESRNKSFRTSEFSTVIAKTCR
ncbi:MAG: methylated-DNA--[protein]-cysteine S-methyltransferase, partial [Planctomycetaceae bacterium]|nr:methylated-DNA--[protein]-cysteine S-methyltransferase [Planctomycetaceae bacterium]